jgi:putative chitinase
MTPTEWRAILVKVAPRGKPWILDGLADAMPDMETKYEINTVNRQAHFLAQLAHESDGFQTTREYASGKAYEGRKDLGNVNRGDGTKFRGRGLIQLTGRANYERASAALNQPFTADPDLVERFPAAATVSGWFWDTHKLNQHADKDDVRQVTKIINGGYNGLAARQAYLSHAKTALA